MLFCSRFGSAGSQRGCGVTVFATEALPPVGESQPWFPTAGGAGRDDSERVIKTSVLHHFKAQSCLLRSVTLVLCAKGTSQPFGPQADAALALIRLVQAIANGRVVQQTGQMEGATSGLGFWHALKVRARGPFHTDMVHYRCSWWGLAEDRAWIWDLVTRAPGNFCNGGKKRNGSWTLDPNPMAINRTLNLFFGELWKFSKSLTPK